MINKTVGNFLIFMGIIIFVIGVLIKLPLFQKLFNLPGDIVIKGKRVTVYFPIVSMIIISVVLSLILNIIFKIFK